MMFSFGNVLRYRNTPKFTLLMYKDYKETNKSIITPEPDKGNDCAALGQFYNFIFPFLVTSRQNITSMLLLVQLR